MSATMDSTVSSTFENRLILHSVLINEKGPLRASDTRIPGKEEGAQCPLWLEQFSGCCASFHISDELGMAPVALCLARWTLLYPLPSVLRAGLALTFRLGR